MKVLRRIRSFITRKKRKALSAYASILTEHFQYFNELTENDKTRFLQRVHKYRRSKNFHYIGHEENVTAEVLISAAAVQLTFGLIDYKMSYFEDIFVMKDAYT